MSRQTDARGPFQLLAEQHPAVLTAELFHDEASVAPKKRRLSPLIALLLRALSLLSWR